MREKYSQITHAEVIENMEICYIYASVTTSILLVVHESLKHYRKALYIDMCDGMSIYLLQKRFETLTLQTRGIIETNSNRNISY